MRGQEVLFSHDSDEHITPPEKFAEIQKMFEIQFDPCATPYNALNLEIYATKELDGLSLDWSHNSFINPPYSNTSGWVSHCIKQSHKNPGKYYVMLVASRTGTAWYREIFENYNALCFIKGRWNFYEHEPLEVHFEEQKNGRKKRIVDKRGEKIVKEPYGAPFACLLAVFHGKPLTIAQQQFLNSYGPTLYRNNPSINIS